MLQKSSVEPFELFHAFVRSWFKLIALGRWNEAFGQIDLPPNFGEAYTPDRFRYEVEKDHFHPGTRFGSKHPEGIIYSDPDTLEGDGRPHLYQRKDRSTYEFDFDLPLNGEWSDLTAGFEFIDAGSVFKVRLDWLHVL